MFSCVRSWICSDFPSSDSVPDYQEDQNASDIDSILKKYPDHVPVICNGGVPGSGLPPIRIKILIEKHLTCWDLREAVRKHAEDEPLAGIVNGMALCLLVGGVPMSTFDMTVEQLYIHFQSPDGFLHITYYPAKSPTVMNGETGLEGSNEPGSGDSLNLDIFTTEMQEILAKHPGKVPVICQVTKAPNHGILSTTRFLSPMKLMSNDFLDFIFPEIENILNVDGTEIDKNMINLFFQGELLEMGKPMGDIYKKYKSGDGFLYVLAHYGNLSNAAKEKSKDFQSNRTEKRLEFTLKVRFGSDFRSWSVSWPVDASSKQALAVVESTVCNNFSPTITPSSLVLKYTNNEGDKSTLVEDSFQEFLSFAQDNILKLTIFDKEWAIPVVPAKSHGTNNAGVKEELKSLDPGKTGNTLSPKLVAKATDDVHECDEAIESTRYFDASTPAFGASDDEKDNENPRH